ncbi:DUF1707 domain-containing protein [Mycolicibacterium sp. 018/SC-01/001]|uniref:DUF1707 SHOCT-like domain-containing protein n=1 Tax=Mycolicibacterium sp. 018/SC-01/001 TaxID=2592069 RepID=UPI00117EA958|nr:DUF1707 domain-containing protein [Mycolicibacterium sp. 018/SC-01/001]TRW85494.1 DUF1707 domain-containing protein [Mycolicibacterium sp. 018/SC-01/001]
MSEPPDLRVSDADRTAVRRLLERAVGHGMLNLDEYSERLDTVFAARTRRDLDAVIADLPFQRQPVAPAPAPSEDVRSWMSSITRKGPWTVPPRLRLITRMCSTTLDFTSAVLPGPVAYIDVDDYFGSVELILPDGATADCNQVSTFGGSTSVRVATGAPSQRLHIVVTGKVRFGSLTVRHPFGSTLRQFLR